MNNHDIFNAIIGRDGTIYKIGFGNKYTKLGIDNEAEQDYINTIAEMQSILDEYFNEYGELPTKLTPEQEQIQEQQAINTTILETLQFMQFQINSLKGGATNDDVDASQLGENESGNARKSNGKKPGGNKTSSKQGSGTAAGTE